MQMALAAATAVVAEFLAVEGFCVSDRVQDIAMLLGLQPEGGYNLELFQGLKFRRGNAFVSSGQIFASFRPMPEATAMTSRSVAVDRV